MKHAVTWVEFVVGLSRRGRSPPGPNIAAIHGPPPVRGRSPELDIQGTTYGRPVGAAHCVE